MWEEIYGDRFDGIKDRYLPDWDGFGALLNEMVKYPGAFGRCNLNDFSGVEGDWGGNQLYGSFEDLREAVDRVLDERWRMEL